MYKFSVWQPMYDSMVGTYALHEPFETKELAIEYLKKVKVDPGDYVFVKEIKVYGGNE